MVVGTKKSVVNSTNNGAVVRNNSEIKNRIIKFLKESENPLSTSDLSVKLKKAWHTIDRNCLMLQIEGKVDGFKIGKMNLWRLKV